MAVKTWLYVDGKMTQQRRNWFSNVLGSVSPRSVITTVYNKTKITQTSTV